MSMTYIGIFIYFLTHSLFFHFYRYTDIENGCVDTEGGKGKMSWEIGIDSIHYSSVGKESACNAGDSSSIPEWVRSAGEEF